MIQSAHSELSAAHLRLNDKCCASPPHRGAFPAIWASICAVISGSPLSMCVVEWRLGVGGTLDRSCALLCRR
jgi:hypothetical protein